MNRNLAKLASRYLVTLREYLADEREAILEQAYELGRVAIARGLGVLDMVRLYQHALEFIWPVNGQHSKPPLRAAETFFLESLSPFEATHRGFRETNAHLQQLIGTLEKRNAELAKSNRALCREIRERTRTEKALRDSEEHFRDLVQKARRMEDDLRHLSNQILRVQEEERKHISRELHDEVGQALTAISMTLATLNAPERKGQTGASRQLTVAQRLVQETMEAVHGFARELRPTMLDELGLLPALRSYLNAMALRTGLRARFQGTAQAEALTGDQKTVLFRVAQESLTNVVKHAQASRVTVALRKTGDAICMEVKDNGKSFKPGSEHSPQARKRLGVLGMQERVRLVHGRFAIKAEPGRGTTIRAVIPFNAQSELAPAGHGPSGHNGSSPTRRARSKHSGHQPQNPSRNLYGTGKNQSSPGR